MQSQEWIMAEYECNSCGVIDSLHVKDVGTSKLVVETFRGRGEKGLDVYAIFCRCCLYVSFYQPGWFGNIKVAKHKGGPPRVMDGVEMIENHRSRGDDWEFNYFFDNTDQPIFSAMIEDGVWDVDWEEYMKPNYGRKEPINVVMPTEAELTEAYEYFTGKKKKHQKDQRKLKNYRKMDYLPKR
jgi:hypothetical protein